MVKFKVLNNKKEECSYEFNSIDDVLTSYWVKRKDGPKLPESNAILTSLVVDSKEYILKENTKFSVAIVELSTLHFTRIYLDQLLREFNSKITIGEPTSESITIKGKELISRVTKICALSKGIKTSIPSLNLTEMRRLQKRISDANDVDPNSDYYLRWDWADGIGDVLTYFTK